MNRVDPFITRFAPAPTGYLHLGHVLNAMYVWETARAHAGRVLLRIEDHDRQRSRRAFEDAILDDLAWLGFVPDGPLTRQSEREAIYEDALGRLRRQGLVYACACTRAEIASSSSSSLSGDPGRYAGTCAHRTLEEAPGMGLRVRLDPSTVHFDDERLGPQTQQPWMQCGDLLVRDRDGNWTYQFAATVDDWVQGVSMVIRGEDLLESTGRQIQLARLLGRTDVPRFLHHPLLMKTPTQKLSKSDGDTGVRELRARGWTPAAIVDAIPPDLRPALG